MTAVTDIQAQLVTVRAAIAGVLTGAQSVSYGGRSVTLADLGKLQAYESTLLARLTTEQAKAVRRGSRIGYVVPQ